MLFPRVDEAEYQKQLQAVRERLPVPVLWLLGKSQAGKTSIVHALTGHPRAEIGNGFQPCTRSSYLFSFPSPEAPIVHFLDTRGLGEVEYNPEEDLRIFLRQAQLVIVVVRVMDHALQPVIEALQQIKKEKPQWPILIVQSHLHEGYPNPQMEHLEPYPYADPATSPQIPANLLRSLRSQQEVLAPWASAFVAVDLTLPEDGYADPDYGSEALWENIEALIPYGLQDLIRNQRPLNQAFQDLHSRTAHPHIIAHALLAGGIELLPIPFVSLPFVSGIQARLFQALASIYGQNVSWRSFLDFLGALGLGVLAQIGGRELVKFVPIYGTAVSSLYTAAATYALGKTMCVFLSRHHQRGLPEAEDLKALYAQQFEEGRQLLRQFLVEKRQGSPRSNG